MNKSRVKSFLFCFVFALFSTLIVFGGLSFISQEKTDAAVSNSIEIKDAEDFYNKVTNYGASGAISNFVLTQDIDMSKVAPEHRVLHSTIGTQENPFRGTFDGRGYKISNLSIDLSQDITGSELYSTNKYVGLFGLTDGATISNIQLAGTTNFTIGGCEVASVGGLVGSAKNTTIKYIQNVASIKLGQTTFNQSLIYGGLVGSANSSSISYCISRQKDAVGFGFVSNNGRISSIGGVVGSLNDSCFVFGVSYTNLTVSIAEAFVGTVNFGGVFGTVSGSKVFDGLRVSVVNMVVENILTLKNEQTTLGGGKVNAGQIGGAFVSPYPEKLGVSSLYFKKNANTIEKFGDTGAYVFDNPITHDSVLEVSSSTPAETLVNDNKLWFSSLGKWDFDKVWYFSSGVINLQSFLGGFEVKLDSTLSNSSIFNIEKTMKDKYFFEDTAEIVFSFKDSPDGKNLSEYYRLTGVKYGNTDNKVTFDFTNGVYTVSSDPENYSISELNGVYTVSIKNVNRSTAGTYDISYKAEEFTVAVESRLYDANGVFQDMPEPPANLYYVGGTTAFKNMNIAMTYNGPSRSIEARLRNSNLPYALEGWYLEKEGTDDILLGSSNILEIKFGTGEFTENRKIYAKYRNDACRISFDIKGDGIAEIYVGENLITGKVATVSKTASRLKLEIYVKEGYKFDVKRFLDMISTYRGEDTETPFCTWTNQESGDENYYVFNLDMTTLKGEFSEEFSVIIDTEKIGGTTKNWVWYVVGGVGGAVVLGVVIFLIIFFVKRRGSGGGKMGGYSSKKSFKGGYY